MYDLITSQLPTKDYDKQCTDNNKYVRMYNFVTHRNVYLQRTSLPAGYINLTIASYIYLYEFIREDVRRMRKKAIESFYDNIISEKECFNMEDNYFYPALDSFRYYKDGHWVSGIYACKRMCQNYINNRFYIDYTISDLSAATRFIDIKKELANIEIKDLLNNFYDISFVIAYKKLLGAWKRLNKKVNCD